MWPIPTEDQRLFLRWEELHNGRLVGDYAIRNGFTLHLLFSGQRPTSPAIDAGMASLSIEVVLHDLYNDTVRPVRVWRTDAIRTLDASLQWEYQSGCHFAEAWFCGVPLDPDSTFESYSIRNGAILHFGVHFGLWIQESLDGRHTRVSVHATDTVMRLKQKYGDMMGISVDQLRFIFAGRQLEDECTLDDYTIKPDNTVHNVLRLRG
jgi:hypothetical protein